MNIAQIESQRREVDAEATALDQAISAAISSKSYGQEAELAARADRLAERRAELAHEELRVKASAAHPLNGGFAADEGQAPVLTTKRLTGAQVSPLHFSEDALQGLHAAAKSRQSLTVKAFSNVTGLLPAQLAPGVLGPVHENRLLDRLPSIPITASSYDYIRHSSSTGAPAVTGEGALKPEVILLTSNQVANVSKIAAQFGISHEALSDFPTFVGYAHSEMAAQIQDAENAELLSGSGSGNHLLGLMLTSGALTHAVTTETPIDAIEMAIAQLRVGSALAEANLLVLHPSTWSALRRTKDTQGRYLVNPDPTAADGQRLWNVDVLVTTTQAAGAGLLLDTRKFGQVLVREGITVNTGTSTDDFARNIQRWTIEERLALAVERPSALLTLSGLPTA